MANAVRIGNCSGFYGDRIAAMREMLTDGELDFLTGDYLAELTMLILGRDKMKNPERGYAKTFLTQLEECLGLAHERGVRIVANAGWRDPAGRFGGSVFLTQTARKAFDDQPASCPIVQGQLGCYRPAASTVLDVTAFWRPSIWACLWMRLC